MDYFKIEKSARELIEFVIESYEIKCYDDFRCEKMLKLAKELKIFG